MNLDLFEFMELLNKAREKSNKEKVWQRWLAERPLMQEFISFEDYYKKLSPVQVSKRTKEEILKDVDEIRQMAGRR
jgi:hypothetical protein